MLWPLFLEKCSKTLNTIATRVYNIRGGEIDTVNYIIPNETLYISKGESFITPASTFLLKISLICKLVFSNADQWVTINVGGKLFSTTRSTLTRDPTSMLAKMFGNDWESQRDETGAYLIDRSPEYFG